MAATAAPDFEKSRQHTPSLLRWAGSKRALLPRLAQLLGDNVNEYVEPFCGSAALFFSLRPQSAALYDLNPNLIQALSAVKRDHKSVFDAFQLLDGSKETYYLLRQRYNHEDMGDIEAAAAFLYLNRYGFNGLWRTNLKGHFNVPFGGASARPPDEAFFDRCAHALANAELATLDFRESLPRHRGENVTIFADPPYSTSSQRTFKEYGPKIFQRGCFEELTAELFEIDRSGARVVLAYCDEPEVREAFEGWNIETVTVKRNVGGFADRRRIAQELLIYNFAPEQAR